MARLLIERGCDIDPRERRWGAPPLGFAAYGNRREMIDLLAPLSRSLALLARLGKAERLAEVLRAEPEQARVRFGDERTLLWWLPDADETAVRVAELVVDYGCDPTVADTSGASAADDARRRGLDAAAATIESAARRHAPER